MKQEPNSQGNGQINRVERIT